MKKPELFIEKITINKVRHLKDVEIAISSEKRKHLILTGKNGSGKTSVLDTIKNEFKYQVLVDLNEQKLLEKRTNVLPEIKKENLSSKDYIRISTLLVDAIGEIDVIIKDKSNKKSVSELNQLQKKLNNLIFGVNELNNKKEINILLSHEKKEIRNAYNKGKFILATFDAKRNFGFVTPQGGKKMNFKNAYDFKENISAYFLQYLVNLKMNESFARNEKNTRTIKQIDDWFARFEKTLKFLFDDNNLSLKFNQKNFDFELSLANGQTVDFNTLSDGYSAILNIITELMLRMEGKVKNVYDIQGIVLIDEIETHLHIDLQNKILPFLTSFFPKIQFIVSTHSPFVLNSISNAVIYDLEKHIRMEDMSDYPADGIVKSYFDSDEYSDVAIEKMKEYEKLALAEKRNKKENERFYELYQELNDVSGKFAPQLKSEFYRIELERKTRRTAQANG